MRTIIYVDGFNLYFRLLEKRPALKWLNVKVLAERLLKAANVVVAVRYYTARVSGRIDPKAPARQQLYLDALHTVSEVTMHMGAFLLSEKFAGLAKPPEFRDARGAARAVNPSSPRLRRVLRLDDDRTTFRHWGEGRDESAVLVWRRWSCGVAAAVTGDSPVTPSPWRRHQIGDQFSPVVYLGATHA